MRGAEKYCSGLVVVFEFTLLLVKHHFSVYPLTTSIHWVRVSISHHVPQISIMGQKETLNSVFPVVKVLSIKDWRFAIESVSFFIVVIADVLIWSCHCVFLTLDLVLTRLSVISSEPGALIPIEDVKNTRRVVEL